MSDEFEWDPRKDRRNRLKHGVGFDEASTVFGDHLARTRFDESHSTGEDRYIVIGRARTGRILVVVFVERPGRIRIISARLAAPRERRDYESTP